MFRGQFGNGFAQRCFTEVSESDAAGQRRPAWFCSSMNCTPVVSSDRSSADAGSPQGAGMLARGELRWHGATPRRTSAAR